MVSGYQSDAITVELWIYPELQAIECIHRLKVCNSAERTYDNDDQRVSASFCTAM